MIDETLTELARKQVKGLGELEVKQGSVAILQNAGRRVDAKSGVILLQEATRRDV
ncbi:MAG: hypothetical protein QMD22_05690 [archaeon]|nr:hypothetical protein [archaeon]